MRGMHICAKALVPFFEGDGDGGGTQGDPKGGDPKGGDTKGGDPKGGTPNKTFTQDDVNRFLADEKRKFKSQQDKAFAELEALKNKASMTAEERQELEARLETMRNELLTKEELAKQKEQKLLKEHTTKMQELESKAKLWQDKFHTTAIKRAIVDAAVANNAYNPDQLVAQLQGNTRLVEVVGEDGKPTGDFDAKIKLTIPDTEGKTVTLDLSAGEAVKKMREVTAFQNLFKDISISGTGGNNNGSRGSYDAKEIATKDPALYRKLRAEGKLKF